ncbi:MAG TPA: hypothetical protein VGL66_01180 [Caulobacteraceae bacterium]
MSIGFFFATGVANAGQMVAITEVPNSVQFSTSPLGLNDSGMITGSYVGSDGHQHGFVGQANGPYTLFDAGVNANGTEPRAISNTGWITGLGNADSIDPVNMGTMFEATPALTIMPINKNGVQLLGIPQGFNASNVFVGGYYPGGSPASAVNGFYGFNGQWTSDLALPFPTIQVRARAINNSGTVVGLFFTASSTGTSGFIMKNGTVTVINYPDPTQTGTNLEGINDQGVMTGSYSDASGNSHSFLLAADMTTFTLIEPAGSVDNQAWAINKDGEVAISSDVGPFIYCSKNGQGHCKNGKAKFASEVTVRGAPRTFACLNGCRSGVVTNRGFAVRAPVQHIDLRAKPFKRPQ